MGLSMKEKKAVSKQVAHRYRKARKKEKKQILDEFVQITGYTRWYASHVLRNWGRRLVTRGKSGRQVVLVGARKKAVRKKERTYDAKVFRALRNVWYLCDCICGKRLAPYLREIVPKLEACGELKIVPETREKLLEISAATIDRILAGERKKTQLKGRSRTKPGAILRTQIPIRTFSEWNENRPGFMEIDLVSHEGSNPRGDFIQTLDATDVLTGWTETQAVRNKAQIWTLEAVKGIKERLPFPLLGIDSDNGSEFINNHLNKFCRENGITFTRSRPYRKNDNCFVEQKNYSVVRRAVGYSRYDTAEELEALNELYGYLRLYTNFFQPVMKLIEKKRIGSRVKKKYDEAKTPYRRAIEREDVSAEDKKRLSEEYKGLNPVELKRAITRLQDKLMKLAKIKTDGRYPMDEEGRKSRLEYEYAA